MNKFLIVLISLLILSGGVFGFYFLKKPKSPEVNVSSQNNPEIISGNKYTNETYGINFYYPDDYLLDEGEVGNGERGHYVITLAPKDAFPLPAGGEGPPTITIDIYQNGLDNLTLDSWLKNTSFSNFKLSDGKYSTTTISGILGVRYHWSGLYEADTTAFIYKKSIIAISGMYISPEDKIRGDFDKVINSLRLK